MRTFLLSLIHLVPYLLLGQDWTSQTSGTTNTLWGIHFTDSYTGWVVGDPGTIRHTINGGATWLSQTSGTSSGIFDVFFIDANTGWAVGHQTILRTIDGGTTWLSQTSGTSYGPFGVHFVDANMGWAVGYSGTILHTTNGGTSWFFQTSGTFVSLSSVRFIDANMGWAVGESGTIRHTTNGGATWLGQTSGTSNMLRDIHFTDANMGWVVGSPGTILHTTNGGTTWLSQSSGTTEGLYGVQFIEASTGWIVGGIPGSTILHTTNGGTTWLSQSSGTTWYFLDVFFIDANSGWAVGGGGTILHYSVGEIPCDEIDLFQAKCDVSGAGRAMVRLLNSTEYAGETVEFQLDDTVYPVELITNGTHTIGRLEVPQAGYGQHTITLVNPGGCVDAITFNCQVDAPTDPEWDALWAEYDSLFAEQSITQTLPQETKLISNYPNPFNPSTTFRYSLATPGQVSLKVHNMLGQLVRTIVDEQQLEGYHEAIWDGRNENGAMMASGVYIYRMTTGSIVDTKRMLLLK